MVVLRFTTADAPPTYDVLYDGGDRHFAAAVGPYREAAVAVLQRPTGQRRRPLQIPIPGGAVRKRVFNDLTLAQFLLAVTPIPTGSAYFDTTAMKCPFDVRLTFRQPYAQNQVAELEDDVPARHAFIDWLSRQQLDAAYLGGTGAAELLDQTMTIRVPCATIDL